jgi:A/G-specific adenine glycosylase
MSSRALHTEHLRTPDAADAAFRRRLQQRLLSWFDKSRRPLPWRRNRDPYQVWVSEVMLQQTQAATVVRFFEPFLEAFPTLADLAAAEEQDVLRRWEGLGYYRRARNLHRGARALVAAHGGCFPNDPDALQGVPGIGRYTLGAVLSRAFDRRLPIVEANSRRLLCRLFGRRDDPNRGAGRRWLWQTAEAILPRRRVGDFNEALMELGALVCTPAEPACGSCPLARDCSARRLGLQAEIPMRSALPQSIAVQEAAVVVRREQRVLLLQRPSGGRWAGLWEFPHAEVRLGETLDDAAARLVTELTGIRARLCGELLSLRHTIMHYRVSMVCFEASYCGGAFKAMFYQQGIWLEPGRLADYPVSAPQRRLARSLIGQRQRGLF